MGGPRGLRANFAKFECHTGEGKNAPPHLPSLLFTTSMSSPYGYTALASDPAQLPQNGLNTPATSGLGMPVYLEEHGHGQQNGICSRSCAIARKLGDLYQRNIGLLLVIASQAFYSLMSFTVKRLSTMDPPVSTLEVIWVRMTVTYVCAIAYMFLTGVPNPFIGPKGVRLLLLFRGFSGFMGLLCVYYSLQYLSLSDATVLTLLAPICTGFAGAIFLGENFTLKQMLAGLMSLVGVVLIAKPPFLFGHIDNNHPTTSGTGDSTGPSKEITPQQRLIAVGMALLGALGASCVHISLRAIGKRAHPMHTLVFYALQCVIVSPIMMLITKTQFIVPDRVEWLVMLLMTGMFGMIAQILLAMGLARETAGRGAIGNYSQIVFASILERIFFQTVPSITSVIGTFAIIGSALYVAVTQKATQSPETRSKNTPTILQNNEEDAMEIGLLRRDSEDSQGQEFVEREKLDNPV